MKQPKEIRKPKEENVRENDELAEKVSIQNSALKKMMKALSQKLRTVLTLT